MGNGFSQLTYYIGPFLNGCFETVKITKTKKCWKVEFEGHLKSNLKSFFKNKSSKYLLQLNLKELMV